MKHFWLRLCLSLLVLFLFNPMGLLAQEPAAKISLQKAITNIEERFHLHFAYEHDLLKGKFTTALALEGATAEEVLKQVLYPNNLLFLYVSNGSYTIVARDAKFFAPGEQQVAAMAASAPAAAAAGSFPLRGQVIDQKGAALPFVNIWVKGTRRGTQTGDRGEFSIDGVVAGDTLLFTRIGYMPERIAAAKTNFLTVQLSLSNGNDLDEVTVVSTGLQQLPRERATGSFSTISAKQLEQTPTANVVERMEGQVPGVKINVMAGDRSFIYGSTGGNQIAINGGTRTVGDNDYNVSIHGTSTVVGETFPLVVVDGAITDMDISVLNPDDVERITFLKDAAAASIWGVRAANGVIVVTTKKGRASESPAISFSATASVAERPDLNYLRLMNSKQTLAYESELVTRGFLNSQNLSSSSYSYASIYPNEGGVLALQLQAGAISQAAYQHSVDSLGAIDNRGQIQHYLLRPSTSQEYNMSVSGGNYNSTYYYSASYSQEDPNAQRTQGNRLTLSLNNSWKLFKIATLSTSLRGAFFTYYQNGFGVNGLYPFRSRAVLMPYMQLAGPNGKGISYDEINPAFTQTLSSGFVNWQYNYLDELNNHDNVQKDNDYSATVNLTVPIWRGISGSVMYQNERTFSTGRIYNDPASFYYRSTVNYYTDTAATANSLGITTGGILNMINTTVNNYSLRGQLAYDRTIHLNHQVNAIAGIEERQTLTSQGTQTLYGYDPQTGLNTAVSYLSYAYPTVEEYPGSIGGAPEQQDKLRRYLSYYGNAAYTLLEKYSLSGSVRYDDYNNFGLDRRYRATPLWSTGAKWFMSKEHFLTRSPWINTLALRATYGVNGNISTTLYPFTNISLQGNSYTTGLPEAYVVNLPNPQLKWEMTYVTNLGIDYGFFDNRLTGSVDYYRKNGKDLLFNFPINAAFSGTINNGTLTRNAAALVGHGIDVGINGTLVKTRTFSWNMAITFSYNTNKLKNSPLLDSSTVNSYYSSYYPSVIGYLGGYSLDKLLVFRNAGLDTSGLTQIYDRKNTKVGVRTPLYFADLKNAGHTTAPYFGSWNTTVAYKHFSLYALITYQFGGVFLKPSIRAYTTAYYSLDYDLSGDIAKRWQNPGDEAKTVVPGLNGTSTEVQYSLNRYQYSDANVRSSDYIRLREISLSYELPTGWIRKARAKSASLGFGVRNLGLLWKANKDGYDPDFAGYASYSYSLPAARSYNFSFKLNY